jgi:4-amino-4-deoxy-L-arabinose transferase-like glycosyltransferase
MPPSPPSKDQSPATQSPTETVVTVAPGSPPKVPHILVGLSAAALCVSFFLPWVGFLGGGISGFDIQKNFEPYRLIWLMPLFATIVLVLNIAGQDTGAARRLAGMCPVAILIYAVYGLGGDLFKELQIGAWLALIAGGLLVLIPSEPKTRA